MAVPKKENSVASVSSGFKCFKVVREDIDHCSFAAGCSQTLPTEEIGSDLYGFMLTNYDGHQGSFATIALLLASNGTAIQEAWNGLLDEDNEGAYDPTDKYGSAAHRAHVDAAYRFLRDDEGDHYKFQVISHGYGYSGMSKYHSRTSVLSYRYVNGKYEQIRLPAKKKRQ